VGAYESYSKTLTVFRWALYAYSTKSRTRWTGQVQELDGDALSDDSFNI